MRRLKALLGGLLYGLAFLWTLALGLYFVGRALGVPIRVFRFETEPPYLRDALLGGGLLLIALYFLVRAVQTERHAAARIQGRGPQGPIWISLNAVQGFIQGVLRDELGLPKARVRLKPTGKGLIVQVHTTLPLGESVPRLAERVQTRVKARVEERVGVAVRRVEVVAQGVQGEGEGASPIPAPAAAPVPVPGGAEGEGRPERELEDDREHENQQAGGGQQEGRG